MYERELDSHVSLNNNAGFCGQPLSDTISALFLYCSCFGELSHLSEVACMECGAIFFLRQWWNKYYN